MTGCLKIASTVNHLAGRGRPELVDLVAGGTTNSCPATRANSALGAP
jgi:hypothetical protein